MTTAARQLGAARHHKVAQPVVIRLTHWLNVPLTVIMGGSGLQILLSYPFMGPRGAPYRWYPLQGFRPPEWLSIGSWLAGARAVHFAFAWLFVANGLAYVVYQLSTGQWHDRVFVVRRDLPNAWRTALYYVRLRTSAPAQGMYNGLQRLAYTSAVVLGLVLTLSGLAIWKPTQLAWLAACFGGYDVARLVHFLALLALALFTMAHIVLVSLHPKTIVDMVTGGTRDGAAADR
jgi:thiosulfate reductase cytochrome b subunit